MVVDNQIDNNQPVLTIDGAWFKDRYGRYLMLRGVNVGGSSKQPRYRASHILEGFFEHGNVSFVGRPFPLEEADEHFGRLKSWGFTFLRLLVTWEAIEHAGPGLYDEAYLDYLAAVVDKALEHGINLFVDPHQDVWSRFSGGDGAPGWTFEVVGMDITRFSQTGAAIVHATYGDPFPRMIWPTNYSKLAAATMFTLFFGGNDFAPHTYVDGVPVQEFLQSHYINAIKQVAQRLKDKPNVIGYDTMNEPSAGFIGCADLNAVPSPLSKGVSPTPYQAMLLGAGWPQVVEVWEIDFTGRRKVGKKLINPDGVSIWRDGYDCIWRTNGVWSLDGPGPPWLQRPDHFVRVGGRALDFGHDYLRPFINRYAREIRTVHPGAVIFVENEPTIYPPIWGPEDVDNIVYAPHWYDAITLFTKRYVPWAGIHAYAGTIKVGRPAQIRLLFCQQLAALKKAASERMGQVPTLIGEIGIPFDMGNKRAYVTGNFSRQVEAMDASLQAVEANLLSVTLWNYTADNDNQRGDQWNGEDLSIFSRDQQNDPGDIYSGGRALEAAIRPYARATAGEPLYMHYDVKQRIFTFRFRHDVGVTAPSEFFVPNLHYPKGYTVSVSDGRFEIDRLSQTFIYWHSGKQNTHTVQITPQ